MDEIGGSIMYKCFAPIGRYARRSQVWFMQMYAFMVPRGWARGVVSPESGEFSPQQVTIVPDNLLQSLPLLVFCIMLECAVAENEWCPLSNHTDH